MKMRLLVLVVLLMAGNFATADDKKAFTTDKQKFSYAVGFQVGQSLRQNESELEFDAVLQAIQDSYGGKEPRDSVQDMKASFDAFRARRQKEQAAHQAELKELGKKNKAAGDKFLAANKGKDGVKATASGLQYKVLKPGTGKKPAATDTVVVHYRGTLIDGTEFDSSYSRNQPATLPLTSVIKGWQEALPMMTVGSKWQLVIPPSLAYGERGAGSRIGPDETLVFEVELLEVK